MTHSPKRLFVMQHGLHGRASQFEFLCGLIKEQYGEEAVVCHCVRVNESPIWSLLTSMRTHDGIDVCAQRLADDVLMVLEKHPS